VENVEARLAAMHSALKEAQGQLAGERAAGEAHRGARAAAERAAAAAQDRAERQQREAEQRLQRLEAAASAASVQMAEFRTALAQVERERDQLAAEKAERERAAREAAAAVAGARRRAGSGALPAAEGAAAQASPAGSGEAPPSPLPVLKQREQLEPTDVLYLKNVMLKFIDAHIRQAAHRDCCCRKRWAACFRVCRPCWCLHCRPGAMRCIVRRSWAACPALAPAPREALLSSCCALASRSGRTQECEVLLPAVATLLRATPAEYRLLRTHLQAGSSWLPSLMGGGG
jgi:hypothetical protein